MSILNVNFSKIKTKKQFRDMVNDTNNQKFVYCFDEFDYLLEELIVGGNSKAEEDRKSRIQTLSLQISLLKEGDPKVTGELMKNLKSEMEETESFTYASFLSELSGLISTSGRCIIATTNFPEKLPPALIRPGRFDFMLNLSYFNDTETKELLRKIYGDSAMLDNVTFPEDKFTPSFIILKSNELKNIEDMIAFLLNKD